MVYTPPRMRSSLAGTLDGAHTVLTPEYVEFDFVLAGLYSRFLAWLVDGVLVMVLSSLIITVLSVTLFAFPGFASALSFVIYFLVDWGYGIAFETWWSGQTIGKRMMGLRVIQESGVRIGFYQAALRNLVRDGRVRAMAWCFDARLVPPGATGKSDALVILRETAAEATVVIVPYQGAPGPGTAGLWQEADHWL